MALQTSGIFTCDRDGVQSGIIEGSPQVIQLPSGWSQLTFNQTSDPAGVPAAQLSVGGFLCPACTTAFKNFLGPDGAMMKALQPKP